MFLDGCRMLTIKSLIHLISCGATEAALHRCMVHFDGCVRRFRVRVYRAAFGDTDEQLIGSDSFLYLHSILSGPSFVIIFRLCQHGGVFLSIFTSVLRLQYTLLVAIPHVIELG